MDQGQKGQNTWPKVTVVHHRGMTAVWMKVNGKIYTMIDDRSFAAQNLQQGQKISNKVKGQTF